MLLGLNKISQAELDCPQISPALCVPLSRGDLQGEGGNTCTHGGVICTGGGGHAHAEEAFAQIREGQFKCREK